MKKKLLLSHVCTLILSSLSVPSLALGSIEDLKPKVGLFDKYYPDHNHENFQPLGNVFDSLLNNELKAIGTFTGSVERSILQAQNVSPPIPLDNQKYLPAPESDDSYFSSQFKSFTSEDRLDDFSYNDKYSLESRLDNLNSEIQVNKESFTLLNVIIDDLNNDIQTNDQKHLANNETTTNSINELKNHLSTLNQDIKNSELKSQKYTDEEIFNNKKFMRDSHKKNEKKHQEDTDKLNEAIAKLNKGINGSDKITSLLIDEAEKNSKAHADLILHNQQKLNIERFDKLDKQNYLHARQFKQINAKFDHLESKINQTARDANAGIAAVAAMTNIPYTSGTRFSAGLGMGNFKNGKAIAAGAQYQVKQNLNLRSSISWNNSDSAVIGAGVAYGW